LGPSFRGVCLGDGDPGQSEASKVAPVDKLSLVFVPLFAVSFWGERPSVKEWVEIFMISLGVLVLALK
jgi:transporter family protein